jgi:hypothetical protein
MTLRCSLDQVANRLRERVVRSDSRDQIGPEVVPGGRGLYEMILYGVRHSVYGGSARNGSQTTESFFELDQLISQCRSDRIRSTVAQLILLDCNGKLKEGSRHVACLPSNRRRTPGRL